MREAPSRVIIAALARAARRVTAYDPVAMDEARRIVRRRSRTCATPTRRRRACDGADALVVVTEWKEFRSPDFDAAEAQLQGAAGVRRPQPVRARAACAPRGSSTSAIGRRVTPAIARASRIGASASRRARAARRRRRDARPLLVRRRRAHLARGAGAGRAHRAHRGASRRRGQRRAQRRGAGRARRAAVGHRRRRGGPRARAPARATTASTRASCATPRCARPSSCA